MYKIGSFSIVGTDLEEEGDIILPPHPLAWGFWQSSTKLCIEALEKEPITGKSVLDLGTGTGILAVVMAKLGASQIYVTETDPLAIEIAKKTFSLNNVKVTFMYEAIPNVSVDICVANIGAEYVQDMRHQIKANKIITVDRNDRLVIFNA